MEYRLRKHATLVRLLTTCVIGVVVVVLARCAPSAEAPSHALTARAEEAPTGTLAAVPVATDEAAAGPQTPSIEPATEVPAPPAILDVYPLQAGASWTYSVTVRYQGQDQLADWSGYVTETVSAAETQYGAALFWVETTGHPLLNQPDDTLHAYLGLADRLYRLDGSVDARAVAGAGGAGYEDNQILAWPLEVGGQWGNPQTLGRGDGWYVWRVEGSEDVNTPAGRFSNCYRLEFNTNPDRTTAWFCPGVGVARRQYHHNGSLHDESWNLARFIPPAPPGP